MSNNEAQSDKIRVNEIFGPTIQGEGAVIGVPTVFVRTGGCDYRCTWCDTLHAVDSAYRHDWKPMSAQDIFSEIEKLSSAKPLLVTLSGGNPAIQPFGELIEIGKARGYRFALETQGSIAQEWFADLDILTLSPKPPSSGMNTDWKALDACLSAAGGNPEITLKFVVADETDYNYAKETAKKYPQLPVTLQPCNTAPPPQIVTQDALIADMLRLIDRVNADKWFENVRILPQLHVMLWGNKRGV